MKTHEYQAREILAAYSVPFAPGRVAETPDEVETIARDLGGRVVVKAQVHAGGRGKAGGVKLGSSPEEAREHARAMLDSSLKGRTVRKVLVVQALTIAREFYLGAVLDRAQRSITLMASAMGGVDIEEVARSSPGAIVKITADPLMGLADYQAWDLSLAVGLSGGNARAFAAAARSLYRAFLDCDCSLLEVNPLALTEEGDLIALDSKMVVDDNALYRRPALAALRDTSEEEPAEAEAQDLGLSYIKLDGDIGCMVNGAGLAMATMDTIKLRGGEPANFLDIGGGASVEQIDAALRIILKDKKVRAVLVNIFGGITRCDTVAQALADRLDLGAVGIPVVARLVGTNAAEGRQILESTDVTLVTTLSEAAELVVYLARERGKGPR
ncbi:MAG: ADP-forming succinate--CoA ligase subunit beta [bacterium]